MSIGNQTLFSSSKLIPFRIWKNFTKKEYLQVQANKSIKNNRPKQKNVNPNSSEEKRNSFLEISKPPDYQNY